MKLLIHERAGAINLTSIDFGYNSAYITNYNLANYGSGIYSIIIEYIADGNFKAAAIVYNIQSGIYRPLYYREVELSPFTLQYETLFEITDMDVWGYSLTSMLDDIIYAKTHHAYLVSESDTVWGNSYGSLIDTGAGNDLVYGYGGIDRIWIGSGNDTVYGGSGSDVFYTTPAATYFGGTNYAYGGTGNDTLFIEDDQKTYHSVDTFGEVFDQGTEYIVVFDDSNGAIVYASSIEYIQVYGSGNLVSVDNFFFTNFAYIRLNSYIPDKTYTSNDSANSINISDYMASINYGYTTLYSFSLSNSSYSDQFSLSGDTLKVTNGSGTTRTVTVTVSAVNVSSDGTLISNDIPTTDTFTVTFKDNDTSSSTYSGTSGDDPLLTGTSGNDTFTVTAGSDKLDGGAGTDTIIVSDGARIIRSTDVNGSSSLTGIEGKNFLHIRLKEGDDYLDTHTIAWNFEKIQFEGTTSDISSFDDNGTFDVSHITISNKTLSDNSTQTIDLSDYFWTLNEGASLSYTVSSSNSDLSDQLSLSGAILTLNAGTQGSSRTTDVIVRATQTYAPGDDGPSDPTYRWEEQTFTVTMKDDDISGTSGDDTLTLTSSNDTFSVTEGRDKIDGGSGTDTLVIDFDDFSISRSIDVKGFRTGISGQDHIYVRLEDSSSTKFTTAINFEKIQTPQGTWNISDYPYSTYFGFGTRDDIADQILSNNSTKEINLDNILWTYNHPSLATVSYDIESDNSKLSDQISISNGILKLSSGSAGEAYTANITVTAKLVDGKVNVDEDWESATLSKTFSVTMADDDYVEPVSYSLSASASSVDEGSKITYTITGDKTSSSHAIFTYTVEGDSNGETVDKALSNDLTSASGTVTLAAGSTYIYFYVNIASDTITEGIEGIKVTVLDSDKTVVGSKIALINNVDSPVSYSLSASASSVDEGSKITYTITGDKTDSSDAIFTYTVEGDSNGETVDKALSNDLTSASGTVTLAVGSTSITFDVNIASDTITEGIEGIKVTVLDSDQTVVGSKIALINNIASAGYELSASKNDNGPSLSEYSSSSESSGTVNIASSDDMIVVTGQAGTLRGLGGDDTYLISDLMTSNTVINISDDLGNNIIQIPDNTLITKVLFVSNASRLWLGDNQQITISTADQFTFNVSGNSAGGDTGTSLTYVEFTKIFGSDVGIGTGEKTVNLYIKSDAVASSSYNIIDISASADGTVNATDDADDFRYEINNDGTSAEGPYTINISGFDTTNDKLTLVNKKPGTSLTTQEFDQLSNVEVTSDGISGTQILFAPDSNAQSGKLVLANVEESFSGDWTATTYTVEITPTVATVVNISVSADSTITATSDAEDFRYEVSTAGVSEEGAYTVTIDGFDIGSDKLTLVLVDATSNMTTAEFDQLTNVEVTSDGISGTQVLFAPDSNSQSGKLVLSGVEESFTGGSTGGPGGWTATTYTVEILAAANLSSGTSSSDLTYEFSSSIDSTKPVLTEFNSSLSSGVINFSGQDDIIILTGSGKTVAGKSGNDLYLVSELIPKNSEINITDTEGSNIIQIPDNTYIDDTLFTKNATRLTLSDDREITISNADKFTYNLGANITTGDTSENLTYSQFASAFGVDDVLSLSGSISGTITDTYII